MNNEKKNTLIDIVTQAFYGNRVGTEVKLENIERFIVGCLDDFPIKQPLDKTIIKMPNADNIVIVYNKYKEEERKKLAEKLLREENYVLKPLAIIPEYNMKLYSRCIACRMNESGELESLHEGDYDKIIEYFAE